MIPQLIDRTIRKIWGRNSLVKVLTIPVIVQILLVLGLTGYLSAWNGQQIIQELVGQLLHETSDRVTLYLENYLAQPQLINRINTEAVRLGQLNVENLNPENLAKLESHLIAQIKQFPTVGAILYGNMQGDLRAITQTETGIGMRVSSRDEPGQNYLYDLDNNNKRGKLKQQTPFPLPNQGAFDRPWFKAALNSTQSTWSPIFSRLNTNGFEFAINASTLVYDSAGDRQGVFSVTIDLEKVSSFLQQFSRVAGEEIFIVERSGLLVAATEIDKPFDRNPDGSLDRMAARDSRNYLIRSTTEYLQTKEPNWLTSKSAKTSEFKFQVAPSKESNSKESMTKIGQVGPERHFVRYIPFRSKGGLDWLIVTVVPESSFTAQTQQSGYLTLILYLVALILAISGGVWTTRWLVEPLSRLSRAAKAISQGNFYYPVQIDRLDEVGELARSFNYMVEQLQTSFQELQESEEKFRRLAENIPGVTYRYVLHPDGGDEFTYISPQAQDMYGLTADLVIQDGSLLWQKVLPEDILILRQSILNSFQNLSFWNAEYRILKEGQVRWHEAFSTPELQSNGSVIWDGVIIDISDRKQAEALFTNYNRTLEGQVDQRTAELSQINILLEKEIAQRRLIESQFTESEARLHDILGTADAAIVLFQVSPDDYTSKIIYRSQGHLCITGYSLEELSQEGLPEEGSVHDRNLWVCRIHPEDLPHTFYAQTEKICKLGRYSLEYRIYRKDGEVRWISDNLVSRWDQSLQCWFVTAIGIDITDRKLAEAERASQQAFLRQIIDLIPAKIYVKDREGHFLAANQATADFYGTTVETVLGKTAADFNLSLEVMAEYNAVNQEVMATQQTKIIPYQKMYGISGDLQWDQTVLSPFINAHGEVQGIIGTSTDVTVIKHAEEELRRAKEAAEAANQAKSNFLAAMSHELRTPLNAILGFSKIMQPDSNLTPTQKKNLIIISQSGDHLLKLINQVLDLSKIEAQQMIAHLASCDLFSVVIEIEEMLSLKAREKNICLLCKYTADTPQFINTDEIKLRQILLNLLSNALKFTAYGSVSLQISYQEGQIIFSIIDTGVGIDPQEFDRLFQPFSQTTSGQKSQEGTGLGLHLSRQFVHLLGGELTVSSNVGQGSTFQFNLPHSLDTSLQESSLRTPEEINSASLPFLPHFDPLDPSTIDISLSPDLSSLSNLGLNSLQNISLPALWLGRFQQVVVEGDLQGMRSLLQEIITSHPDLHYTLLQLIEDYKLEQLLNLAQSLDSF